MYINSNTQHSSLFIDRFAFIIEEFLATTQHSYDTLKLFYTYCSINIFE